jgi:hypothetical protein
MKIKQYARIVYIDDGDPQKTQMEHANLHVREHLVLCSEK